MKFKFRNAQKCFRCIFSIDDGASKPTGWPDKDSVLFAQLATVTQVRYSSLPFEFAIRVRYSHSIFPSSLRLNYYQSLQITYWCLPVVLSVNRNHLKANEIVRFYSRFYQFSIEKNSKSRPLKAKATSIVDETARNSGCGPSISS